MKEQLQHRNMKKAKKPTFIRQDAHKKPRLEPKWRKPRGSDSKMRQQLKGYRRNIRIGWGSPATVRGLSKDGLKKVMVANVKDLEKAGKDCGIIIVSSVGQRKKIEILKKALEKGITVLNLKKPEEYIKQAEEKTSKKKESKKKKAEEKEKKRKEKPKKKEEDLGAKLEKMEDKTEEEKKQEEKKEKDKLLIKKELQ